MTDAMLTALLADDLLPFEKLALIGIAHFADYDSSGEFPEWWIADNEQLALFCCVELSSIQPVLDTLEAKERIAKSDNTDLDGTTVAGYRIAIREKFGELLS